MSNRITRTVLALAVLLVAASLATAAPPSLRSPEDAREAADLAIASVQRGDVPGAFGVLARYWPLSAEELRSEMSAVREQRKGLRKRLGVASGVEFVRVEEAGDRVLRFTYLERYDKTGTLWRLRFYRPNNVWQVESVEWIEDLGSLFGEPRLRAPYRPPAPAGTDSAAEGDE